MAKPKDADAVLKLIKEKDVKYVDLRFTDPRGKLQHLTMDVSQINEEAFAEGLMFDGSSIALSANSSGQTTSIFTLGRKSTTYSAPR